jgi:hypothetical protein
LKKPPKEIAWLTALAPTFPAPGVYPPACPARRFQGKFSRLVGVPKGVLDRSFVPRYALVSQTARIGSTVHQDPAFLACYAIRGCFGHGHFVFGPATALMRSGEPFHEFSHAQYMRTESIGFQPGTSSHNQTGLTIQTAVVTQLECGRLGQSTGSACPNGVSLQAAHKCELTGTGGAGLA